ncbi:MAG: DUF2258 domain-containing protein [Candidatus Diapherotrites archaeon]|nr:DUF2258 domain-containing protein [Candidatus Diapherotrites archaeon]
MKLINKLSTGLVIAGAYATKVRKTLFAQLKEEVKAGIVSSSEIARAAGELNRILFEILVNRLNIDKGDVVRIRIEYVVEEGKIVWRFNTLEIEAFRRIPDADVREAIQEVLQKGIPSFTYTIKRLGSTPIGDEVFAIYENDEEVGILVATPADGEVVVRGALRNPPRIIEKTKLTLQGSVEETVSKNIQVLSERAKPAADEVVEKVIKEIEDLL